MFDMFCRDFQWISFFTTNGVILYDVDVNLSAIIKVVFVKE